ncbi:uncharacterized protein LOC111278453 [Durio zibethinus]|uniref:Uncharacterized protein LOC111278453 n=1 Tax=Durio zibethinus TaxID=66656 RepID=A0A6P5WY52_DURZI|nr:uncharacterized protein LOC111278453 [Durio zibethinus]
MATQLIESHKENAEIYYGEDVCQLKSLELLEEISLPKGILPVEIVEFGRKRSTGFVWMKLKKKKEHKFKQINKLVSYNTEITFFAEKGGVKKVTGVKSKELFLWVSISDIFIEDPSSGKIFFAIPSGIRAHFPISAFELEEDKDDDKNNSPILIQLGFKPDFDSVRLQAQFD